MEPISELTSQLTGNLLQIARTFESAVSPEPKRTHEPRPIQLLPSEAKFYSEYDWSIHVFPRLAEIKKRLEFELRHLAAVSEDWQQREIQINIFLLSCAFNESVDDYLLGHTCDLSKVKESLPFATPLWKAVQTACDKRRGMRSQFLKRLARWRCVWDQALRTFLAGLLTPGKLPDPAVLSDIERLLNAPLPRQLLHSRPRIPAAFHAQDLTHEDIVSLGKKFVASMPDRERRILIVGLRTAGSYFVPVLHAYLSSQGYRQVESVTIRPKNGLGFWERPRIQDAAQRDATVLVIDEPGGTGTTYARAVDCLCEHKIKKSNIVLMLPVHPTVRDWAQKSGYQRLSRVKTVPLEPEEYQKQSLLGLESVCSQIIEYFHALGYARVVVRTSERSEEINRHLSRLSEEKSQNRFKRVFEVNLERESGVAETRFVLGKSVGWGWLSYHAVIAGDRLAGFVAPVFGLRNGILFSEWIDRRDSDVDRKRVISTIASYVAQRVRRLPLPEDATPELAAEGRHFGVEKLIDCLGGAHGNRLIVGLKRPRMRKDFGARPVPCPTFIDSRMRQLEWIENAEGMFKSDFEQHGLGKYELSITDPAYDLAEAILAFGLSEEEEHQLLDKYTAETGDADVLKRLFINKVQTGTWALSLALSNLADSRLVHRHPEFHKRFTEAWNFLTIHAARRCGSLGRKQEKAIWKSPIVVLDIDGVIDNHTLGFPTTTAAGIEAMSLLQAHGICVALDTARSIEEVKEYCRAYGCAGGVAEYGAWVWDATTSREAILIDEQERTQLAEVARNLRRIPGVFLNDSYHYSIRAFTYGKNGTVPLPTAQIETLMRQLGVNKLKLRQTSLDTTILAASTDKGRGLVALQDLANIADAETIAVGDTEPDIPMFAASTRCFAPANINCRSVARSLGCQVVEGRCQIGLLQIARRIVHADGNSCEKCVGVRLQASTEDIFTNMLRIADRGLRSRVVSALTDPLSLTSFRK